MSWRSAYRFLRKIVRFLASAFTRALHGRQLWLYLLLLFLLALEWLLPRLPDLAMGADRFECVLHVPRRELRSVAVLRLKCDIIHRQDTGKFPIISVDDRQSANLLFAA